jgi:sterol desaturase/sphingolipid hydroxylase (fatty acid hydroxylase superfamily)
MNASYLLEHESALRLGLFALVLGLMATWEWAAPRRALAHSRLRRWRTNLGLVAFNALLLRVLLPTTAIGVAELAHANGWGLLNYAAVNGWAGVVIAALALDLVIYVQHVLFHAVPVLARLHQVHHADPDFDATTGLRFHPFEIMLSMLIKFAAIVALGAPALAVLLFELALNLTAVFNHGNVRLPGVLDVWLRRVVVTPDMHRVHHSMLKAERDSNYGFCLAIWDRVFGTYVNQPAAGHDGMQIGMPNIQDTRVSTSFSGALAIPFAVTAHAREA